MTAALLAACVSSTTYEQTALQQHERGAPWHALAVLQAARASAAADTAGSVADKTADLPLDGTLDGYLVHAMRHHAELVAAFEDWRAAVFAIAQARQWPAPTVSYGLFLRRVETRVGPQRQRFGLRQMLPWPAARRAAAASASNLAEAAERRFEATALAVRSRVARAYWQLWSIHRIRDIERAQRALMAELSASLRTRIAVGKATLADLVQVDLRVSQRDDALASLDAQERQAQAALRYAVGAAPGTTLPMATTAPTIGVPAASLAQLTALAHGHPRITEHLALEHASIDQGRVHTARGRPDVTLGLDYIETGAASAADVPGSGKDAVLMTMSMSLPIWRGQYRAGRRQARAQAAAHRARRQVSEMRAIAELDATLAQLTDGARRSQLYQHTLIPQAETAYATVVGSYHTGVTDLANVLMAHQSVLELQRQQVRVMAEHARAWAQLEDVVGRAVSAQSASSAAGEAP